MVNFGKFFFTIEFRMFYLVPSYPNIKKIKDQQNYKLALPFRSVKVVIPRGSIGCFFFLLERYAPAQRSSLFLLQFIKVIIAVIGCLAPAIAC
jgi:hypothetical protein